MFSRSFLEVSRVFLGVGFLAVKIQRYAGGVVQRCFEKWVILLKDLSLWSMFLSFRHVSSLRFA